MSELLPFDTETNCMPLWKERSESEGQPHMVQLAVMRVDEDTRQVKQTLDVIIKPEGWTITQETIDIHGITQEYAMDVGVSERTALEMFLAMHEGCSKRIAYNTTFDNRIIRIGLHRYFGEEIADKFKEEPYECAMRLANKAVKAKSQTLEVAYKALTGKDLINAHSALADTQACLDVYFAAKDCLNNA